MGRRTRARCESTGGATDPYRLRASPRLYTNLVGTLVRTRVRTGLSRGRTARLPRRSGHDRAGSLSLAFLDFPVQHLQGVLLTGSEGERPAVRFPAVHRRRGYAEQAGDPPWWRSSATRRPVGWNPDGGAPVRRGFPRRVPAASGGPLPSGRRAAVRRVEIDAEDVRQIAGEDVVPRRGVRQRHVADDQVFGVDVPQAEEQLGTVVEPAADAVEHGGRVLAHHRPVGTVASEGNLAGFREQAAVGIGDDAQDVIGQPPLEQLDFPVQHLQGVLLTGSEGERPAGRFPAVHTVNAETRSRTANSGTENPPWWRSSAFRRVAELAGTGGGECRCRYSACCRTSDDPRPLAEIRRRCRRAPASGMGDPGRRPRRGVV